MTSALEDAAVEEGAAPFPPYSSIEFSPQPYQKVVVYLSGTPQFDNEQIDYALERFWHGYLKNQQIEKTVSPAASHPAPAQRSQSPQGSAQQGSDDRLSRSWGACPDCGVAAKASIAQYQQWEEDDEGNEVPAKHFCGNDACSTKSLWRRQLVPADVKVGSGGGGQADLDPDDLPF